MLELVSAERPPARSTRRMRVLQIGKFYPPYRGGIETHLQLLSERLAEQVDVEVAVSSEDSGTSAETVNGIRVTRVGTWCRPAGAPVSPALWRTIRTTDADIVHLHLPNPPAVLAYLASRCKARLVLTYHSDIVRQRMLGKLVNPLREMAMRRAAAVIATSPHSLNNSPLLVKYRDRAVVIPFGVPLEGYDECALSAIADVRRRFGQRIVLAVGRLIYYKGFSYLVQAMQDLDAALVLIGDGPLRAELENLAHSLGVEHKVHFLGLVDDIVPYYRAADVFALPSVARSEAFGIVQLEAMACRTPVVNTWLDSGVPYVSLDGLTGFTVPPADPQALAEALSRLLDDETLRRQFGAAGRQRVERIFSVDAMVDRTLRVYKSVTAEGSVAAGVSRPAGTATSIPVVPA